MTERKFFLNTMTRLSDMLAVVTLTFVFVWSVLYSYGIYSKSFFLPLPILFGIWVGYLVIAHRKMTINKSMYVLLGIVGIVTVSCIVNAYLQFKEGTLPDIDLQKFAYIDVAVLLMAFIIYGYKKKWFVLGMNVLSLFILGTALHGYRIYKWHLMEDGIFYRPFSIYGNPIPAGHIFLIFLWIPFVPNSRILPSWARKIDPVIRAILYIPFIFLTQSRSVWLGLVMSVAVWTIINFKSIVNAWNKMPKIFRGTLLIVFATIIGICTPFVYRIIAFRFTNLEDQQPYRLRLNYIRYTLEQFANSNLIRKIFGYGNATSREMIVKSPYLEDMYNVCDNAYMSMLYEWGIIAIIAVVIIDVIAIKTAIRCAKTKCNEMFNHCAYALIACVIPTFFYDVQMWYTVTVLIAYCIAAVMWEADFNTST